MDASTPAFAPPAGDELTCVAFLIFLTDACAPALAFAASEAPSPTALLVAPVTPFTALPSSKPGVAWALLFALVLTSALAPARAPVTALRDPIDPDSGFMRDWWKISIDYDPEFARRQRRDAAAIPARVWRAIADQCLIGVDLRSMLPRVRASTLLIWGARDTLISDAGREALRSGIAQVDVRTFSSLGHDLFWEDPRAVAAVMTDFLANP